LDDTELFKLIPFLKLLVDNEEKDVRRALKMYRDNYGQYVKDFGTGEALKN
jgi:hypothetical protein